MPFGCLGGTLGVLGDVFGVIWGLLVALWASFVVPWWHFWRHLGCLGGTFSVIGAVLGRLGRQGPQKIEKVAIVACCCRFFLGGYQNHTKNQTKHGALETHQKLSERYRRT